jgi:hypothetical protein
MKPGHIAAYWANDAQTKGQDPQRQINDLGQCFAGMRAELTIARDEYLSEARHCRGRIFRA